MTKKIFIIAILTLLTSAFGGCTAAKDADGQTDGKKIIAVVLDYCDVEKVNVESVHWELILNVLATAKYDEEQYDEIKNPDGRTEKMRANDFTLTVKYDDESVDTIQVWQDMKEKIHIGHWYFIDGKYSVAFYGMLDSYISK